LLKPGTPEIPIYRDGLMVRPNNLKCDADGRNCKFDGAMPGSASAKPAYKYTPPPCASQALSNANAARGEEEGRASSRSRTMPHPSLTSR
jgi:hypothetical protein